MKKLPLFLAGLLVLIGAAGFLTDMSSGAPTWESKHIYSDQWLYFELGTLDQGTIIEYGIRVTTPDESVNVGFMDSTNYAAFSSNYGETFVGHGINWQVRSREGTFEIPYQQQWYFVAISDSGYEIDIDYYAVAQESNLLEGACCGGFLIGFMALLGAVFLISYIRK